MAGAHTPGAQHGGGVHTAGRVICPGPGDGQYKWARRHRSESPPRKSIFNYSSDPTFKTMLSGASPAAFRPLNVLICLTRHL